VPTGAISDRRSGAAPGWITSCPHDPPSASAPAPRVDAARPASYDVDRKLPAQTSAVNQTTVLLRTRPRRTSVREDPSSTGSSRARVGSATRRAAIRRGGWRRHNSGCAPRFASTRNATCSWWPDRIGQRHFLARHAACLTAGRQRRRHGWCRLTVGNAGAELPIATRTAPRTVAP
jgi:hypothetical protein